MDRDDKFTGGDDEALAMLRMLDPSAALDSDDEEIVGIATGEDYKDDNPPSPPPKRTTNGQDTQS